ncbi:gamma-mobile-trio recombinase GmtY [Acidithiobacillus ferridurans]|jgi:hypothetical protein|uniref:Tyrosine recombinase XerC n=2 Tax=Acidithiobacillus ferridurans TaxID=1232575 RepID=A0A2Z6IKY4_ACIFI|nr:gamma-mobile-trio recombinase GmtY [Acidithiobacillus ferridurans]BBF66294.1 Tyrosine recombinase XerC [Acidithiobacillus ferridurans]BBF66471.1 Tyrosine recombinase XerC [Acidithiobacillus ferridurans]
MKAMTFVSVNAKIVTDTTGAVMELPVLLTPEGVLGPLLDYCLARSHNRSLSWMKKVVLAVTLFLRYVNANPEEPNSYRLFQNFAQRLYSGTFDLTTGLDPSNLCWQPYSINNAGEIIHRLSELFGWLGEMRPEAENINPRYAGDAFDRKMDEIAYLYRREKAFLGHGWAANPGPYQTGYRTRPKMMPRVAKSEPPAFPDNRFEEFLLRGFKVAGKHDYRGMLITLLLHGGGLRVSEPFHLYLQDVFPSPENNKSATVLVHHPHQGYAPSDWTDQTNKGRTSNRAQYLAKKYALAPRTEILGSQGAGWKNPRLDNKFYMTIYWFQPWFGEWFKDLWLRYLEQVACLDRNHPFAFVNLYREPRGSMYTIDKFTKAHGAAVERLGLTVRKQAGTTPHGHRHAYGRRLKNGGLDTLLIQRCMHHASEESQIVYTQATMRETLIALRDASGRMQGTRSSLQYEIGL